MKELTRHEFCRLMSAINRAGIDNSMWVIQEIGEATNAQEVFGTDDNGLTLEAGTYAAVYFEDADDYSYFQRLIEDIIVDCEKCALLDVDCLIFCVEK